MHHKKRATIDLITMNKLNFDHDKGNRFATSEALYKTILVDKVLDRFGEVQRNTNIQLISVASVKI